MLGFKYGGLPIGIHLVVGLGSIPVKKKEKTQKHKQQCYHISKGRQREPPC